MILSLSRQQCELWLIGSFLRDPPDHERDRAGLAKAQADLLEAIRPEQFHDPLLRSAWLAVVDEISESGRATPEGVCSRIGAKVRESELQSLMGLLNYAKGHAVGLRSNGRIYAKELAERATESEIWPRESTISCR